MKPIGTALVEIRVHWVLLANAPGIVDREATHCRSMWRASKSGRWKAFLQPV